MRSVIYSLKFWDYIIHSPIHSLQITTIRHAVTTVNQEHSRTSPQNTSSSTMFKESEHEGFFTHWSNARCFIPSIWKVFSYHHQIFSPNFCPIEQKKKPWYTPFFQVVGMEHVALHQCVKNLSCPLVSSLLNLCKFKRKKIYTFSRDDWCNPCNDCLVFLTNETS